MRVAPSPPGTVSKCWPVHPTLGAHRGSYLVLFQGEWPLQDPTTLALNLWNSMVSCGAFREAAVPARGFGLQEGRDLRPTPTLPSS